MAIMPIDNPVDYITKNSQRKREIIEAGEDDLRICRFRVLAGDYPFKDLIITLTYEAYHNLLEDNGIMREFTKERMNGTY